MSGTLHELSLKAASDALRAREVSSVELTRACIRCHGVYLEGPPKKPQ